MTGEALKQRLWPWDVGNRVDEGAKIKALGLRLPWAVLLLWLLLAGAVGLRHLNVPRQISNDGVQYLLGSEQIAAGHGYRTPILFFDEHYAALSVPAPQTVWPPGYPFLLSVLQDGGLDGITAAGVVSLLSFAAIVCLVFLLTLRLTHSLVAGSLAAFWQLCSTDFWFYISNVNSDLPFIVLLLAILALLVPRPSPVRIALISLTAGIGVAVRYAGAFVLASVLLWVLVQLVPLLRAKKVRDAFWLFFAALPGPVVLALLMWRNWSITGGLRGGNSKSVSKPLMPLVETTGKALFDLLAGFTLVDIREGGVRSVLAGAAAVLLGVLLGTASFRAIRFLPRWSEPARRIITMLAIAALYLGGMIILGTRTMLTYDARYILPLVPVLIVVAVSCLLVPLAPSVATRNRMIGIFAACGVLIIALNQILAFPRRAAGYERFFANDDLDAVQWLVSRSSPGDRIIAVGNGQRLGYYTGRPTLAIPEREFTSHEWNEAKLREVAEAYSSRYVFASKRMAANAYPPSLLALAGGSPPPWLQKVYETDESVVYRVE